MMGPSWGGGSPGYGPRSARRPPGQGIVASPLLVGEQAEGWPPGRGAPARRPGAGTPRRPAPSDSAYTHPGQVADADVEVDLHLLVARRTRPARRDVPSSSWKANPVVRPAGAPSPSPARTPRRPSRAGPRRTGPGPGGSGVPITVEDRRVRSSLMPTRYECFRRPVAARVVTARLVRGRGEGSCERIRDRGGTPMTQYLLSVHDVARRGRRPHRPRRAAEDLRRRRRLQREGARGRRLGLRRRAACRSTRRPASTTPPGRTS